jgi:hypothetical protein
MVLSPGKPALPRQHLARRAKPDLLVIQQPFFKACLLSSEALSMEWRKK